VQVDPVQQRTRDPRLVALYLIRPAATAGAIAGQSCGAGIHGSDQLKVCRKGDLRGGSGDGDPAILEGFPQGVEYAGFEVRQLIEEQNTLMRKGNFTGTGLAATSDHGGHRGRVVRIPDWRF
jgi:hypothetical protein